MIENFAGYALEISYNKALTGSYDIKCFMCLGICSGEMPMAAHSA